MKKTYKFILLLLICLSMGQFVNSGTAKAAVKPGWFTGASNTGSGDFVMPQKYTSSKFPGGVAAIPDWVNTLTGFQNFVEDRYLHGDAWERQGAAFIIQYMRNTNDHNLPSSADISEWKQMLNDWASNGMTMDPDRTYSYNGTEGACINSMNISNHAGDGDPEDIALYDDCGSEAHTIVFIFPNGDKFAIKRRCANPVGGGGIPLLKDWTLKGTSSINNTTSVIAKPGSTVTFRHSVLNQGPSPANYNWEVRGNKNGGGYSTNGLTAYSGTVSTSSPTPKGSKNPSAIPNTFVVPSNAQNGDVFCQRIYYGNATGPNTGFDHSVGLDGINDACVKVGVAPPTPSIPICRQYHLPNDGTGYKVTTPRSIPGHTKYRITVFSTDQNYVSSIPSPTTTATFNNTWANYSAAPDDQTGVFTNSTDDPVVFDRVFPSPKGHDRLVYVEYWVHNSNGTWTWNGFHQEVDNCYSASCSLDTTATDPNGGITNNWPGQPVTNVKAGSTYKVFIKMTNTGKDKLDNPYPWSNPPSSPGLTGTDIYPGPHPVGVQLDPGESTTADFDITAPNSAGTQTLTVYPDLWGYTPLGNACPVTVNVYQLFNLSPGANLNFIGDEEDPSGVSYETYVNTDLPSSNTAAVSATSSVTAQTSARGNFTIGSYSGGNFSPGRNNLVPASNPPGTYNITYANKNGDKYCWHITLNYTRAWIGPGGSIVEPTGGYDDGDCYGIRNKPYFKVYGSSIAAGGNFYNASAGTCKGGGELAGWYRVDPAYSSTYTFGASTQLSALALKQIVGFGSARTALNRSPTELTLASTTATSTGSYSPNLAGAYDTAGATTRCLTSPPQGAATPVGTSTSISGLTGAHTGSGPFVLTGGSIPSNKNVSLYVDGDVYIEPGATKGIRYDTGNWTKDNVPSFVLHATGNIYIAAGVTTLDGLYISEPANTTSTKGNIYTCATRVGTDFDPVSRDQLYSTCNRQLTINGSFVAKKVNLLRTYGSLRDEKATLSGGSPAGTQLGLRWYNSFVVSLGMRCTQISEPSDPHSWNDNYLCLPNSSSVHLRWANGAGGNTKNDAVSAGYPYCYQWTPSDPDYWHDNWLCSDTVLNLTFNTSNDPSKYCTRVYEPSDPDGQWASGYYLCEPRAAAAVPPGVNLPDFANLSCSNAGEKSSPRQTCAAEVFDFSPEFFIANQALKNGDTSTGIWTSVTSLPPVL